MPVMSAMVGMIHDSGGLGGMTVETVHSVCLSSGQPLPHLKEALPRIFGR
jgi:hypothetical protein